ncbi:Uncharacterised protein [Mycobacteroides abscessus subsp. abscessus]|nr:Uncharacterised protein [Mycobacteroides abscessus subsp. abscessus]
MSWRHESESIVVGAEVPPLPSSVDCSCAGWNTSWYACFASVSEALMRRSSVRSMRLSRRFSSTHALVPERTRSMRSIMMPRSLVVRDHSSQKLGREGRDCCAT